MQRAVRVLFSVAVVVPLVGLLVLAWGDWNRFWIHPARVGAVVVLVLAAAGRILSLADSPLAWKRRGEREDVGQRFVFLTMIPLTLLLFYIVPYSDSHNWLVLGGDKVRYIGLLVLCVGLCFRVVPMAILGFRFSGYITVQKGHTLVTNGLYRYVRHPNYLGGLLGLLGLVLVFRAGVGLPLLALAAVIFIARINAEERLLASVFGREYEDYRRRSWRLVPFVY